MKNQPDYFVCMISYKSGNEATVDTNMLWSDALDLVHEAAGDGHPICFVHHVKDGKVTDRTQEALDLTLNFLSDVFGDGLTSRQIDFVEHHYGIDVARHFRSAA